MLESNNENFDYKPLTLYSFFPKNQRFKLTKQDININSKENKIYLNNEAPIKERNNLNRGSQKKSIKWTNVNSKYNYNFAPSKKTMKFNGVASSTSNNFYNHNARQASKKYSMNYNNANNYNYNYGFKSVSQKKNKANEIKNRNQDRIKSVREVNFHHLHKINNKELDEQFLEQFLDNYDDKLQRNMKDIQANYSNNNCIHTNSNNIKSTKNNLIKSTKTSKISNDYINSIKYRNAFKLNNEKAFKNYLPYLKSASKDTKMSPKLEKQVLLYENANVNTADTAIVPTKGRSESFKKNLFFSSNNNTFNQINIHTNSSNKKNNKLYASSNPAINDFNNNNYTTNSNISNTGNNNIIFNNVGSVGIIINNYNNNDDDYTKNYNDFEEIRRTNTAGFGKGPNINYILGKKSSNNIKHDTIKKESHKNNEDNLTSNQNTSKEKVNNNFKTLKEKEDINSINDIDKEKNRARAFSTVPYKNRKKKSTKTTINIDCNNPNKEKQITNEKNNDNKNEQESTKAVKKDKLAKYEIGDSLGKGAYATVKLVINKNTQEKFAMKIYEKENLNSNSKKKCVYKEIQILKKLRHKNIVKLKEVIITEKQILIVQELIEGISLREYYNNEIRNQKGISIHKELIFKNIFRQIFEAMNYVHKLGMAHRDIKLENILIKKNYEIKIIDFGFGMYNPENKLQKFFCGTPNYMPPEIAEKKPYVGQLADMWSLGILVYKIFCADFPFKGKNEKELYKAIKSGKFTMASYTPEYAKKIICSLIVLNPNERMTCEEVLNSDWLKNK